MKSHLTKAPDGTITLTITIAKADVAKAQTAVIAQTVAKTELPGFRKGKAPKNLVEEKIDPLTLQEDTLRSLLPTAYTEAVAEHNIKPIMNPKIHVESIEKDADWQFTATTCEAPEVTLGAYKDAVKSVTAKAKIVLPGKKQQEISFDEVLDAVLTKATVGIPTVLLEAEVDRLLSQLLDEVKTLGLSLDQYLASTHKTVEEVKKDYEERAKRDAAIEFVLQKIADDEKIQVSQQEITEAIAKATTPEEKENLQKNTYLLAAILRQQKTFDFLKNL